MRTAPFLFLLSLAVTMACAPTAAPPPATTPEGPYGMTVEEEAAILAMEDQRAYDATLVEAWVKLSPSI